MRIKIKCRFPDTNRQGEADSPHLCRKMDTHIYIRPAIEDVNMSLQGDSRSPSSSSPSSAAHGRKKEGKKEKKD